MIESSWGNLQESINKPNVTLDDLIDAHNKYLQQITHKGLLGGASIRAGKKRSASDTGDESFLSQLHEILKIMLQYKDAVDGLYGFSVTEFTRRQERGARIETRTGKGDWGVKEKVGRPPRYPKRHANETRTGMLRRPTQTRLCRISG